MQLAGLAEDDFAVAFEVFAEAERTRVGVGEEVGEEGLAFEQRKVAEVVAVEVEEVEDEVGEGLLRAVLKGGLEVGEAGGAVVGEDDDFAVEDAGLSAGRSATCGGDGLHAVGPVEAGAGEELDCAGRLCGPGCGSRRA